MMQAMCLFDCLAAKLAGSVSTVIFLWYMDLFLKDFVLGRTHLSVWVKTDAAVRFEFCEVWVGGDGDEQHIIMRFHKILWLQGCWKLSMKTYFGMQMFCSMRRSSQSKGLVLLIFENICGYFPVYVPVCVVAGVSI